MNIFVIGKSNISSKLQEDRPKSAKSVRLNFEPSVRYFDSTKSITKDICNMSTVCGYQSNISSSAMDVDSRFSSKCTLETKTSDFYYPSDETKCNIKFKIFISMYFLLIYLSLACMSTMYVDKPTKKKLWSLFTCCSMTDDLV